MGEQRLPLIKGRIFRADPYQAPTGFGRKLHVPSLDPRAHRARLLEQLDAIAREVASRPPSARDEFASREIIAVQPSPGEVLAPEQLDNASEDARLIGVDPESGTVLLDVASPKLDYLREKLDAFADDAQVRVKVDRDGSETLRRESDVAVAPLGVVKRASLAEVGGPWLRDKQAGLADGRAYWFEIACRGGYRQPESESSASRSQVARQLHRIGAPYEFDEFAGPERIYFFVQLSVAQLEVLRDATDCIYAVELAPPALRDLKLLDDVTTSELKTFVLYPPPAEAPAVVVLDTGIATEHPLLKPAILSATTAGKDIPSPEDTHGHGTRVAGVALYRGELGAAIERGETHAPHWLQSSRLLVSEGVGTAAGENSEHWPTLTAGAVTSAEDADPTSRERVFTLAIARTMQEPPFDGVAPTLWSHAIDVLAFNKGRGRLFVVAAGNARYEQLLALAEQYPQLQLSEKIHEPGQAVNALTVGAFTDRVELPPSQDFAEAKAVAPRPGGISPFTSTGPAGKEWPIKPDVVLEGGNLAILSGGLPDVTALAQLTTGSRHTMGHPLSLMSMTSESAARGSHLAARVWTAEPKLRPETVRGLVVHSATWTKEMLAQFGGPADRLSACGYGVPDERIAVQCAKDRATIVIEDSMPNAVWEEQPRRKPPKRPTTKATELKDRRKLKLFRLPIPDQKQGDVDADVELRVTLSFFTEPNLFGRSMTKGLDLKWDMQGPHETEDQFLGRINALKRPKGADGKRTKDATTSSFDWIIGPQARGRGTVQSDRWRGRMSEIAGPKLIAVIPVLGWWDQRRRELREQEMRFSLVVSVFAPGAYSDIKPAVELPVHVPPLIEV